MKNIWIFLTFLLFLVQPALAKDIVFDLDWTLFYPTTELEPRNRIVEHQGRSYRLADQSEEVLYSLSANGHRISIFSGGDSERNSTLIEFLGKSYLKRFGIDLNLYKKLSNQDLTQVSSNKDHPFAERYKKDLSKVNPNLNEVILVDDIKGFSLQKDRTFWIGRTYNDRPTFRSENIHLDFEAPNQLEYQRERNKLVLFLGWLKKHSETQIPSHFDPHFKAFDFIHEGFNEISVAVHPKCHKLSFK